MDNNVYKEFNPPYIPIKEYISGKLYYIGRGYFAIINKPFPFGTTISSPGFRLFLLEILDSRGMQCHFRRIETQFSPVDGKLHFGIRIFPGSQ